MNMYGLLEPHANSDAVLRVAVSYNPKKPSYTKRYRRSETQVRPVTVNYLDYELCRLQSMESELKDAVTLRKVMSESDYSRRRDELNRLLKKEEQEIREIIKERDQALKDKRNVESAYADVQEKYERVLKSMLSLKEKEELLVERDNEYMLKVKELDEQLENFKEDAHRQVMSEYQNWLLQLAETEATNMRLKAMIRKADLKVEKLEHELGQKNKENSELHDLCDDLINSSRRSSRQDQ